MTVKHFVSISERCKLTFYQSAEKRESFKKKKRNHSKEDLHVIMHNVLISNACLEDSTT